MDANTICTRCDKIYDDVFMEIKNINEVDCIPFRFIQNGKCWCFCIEALYKWVTTENNTNPMTREILSKNIINRLKLEYSQQDRIEEDKDVIDFMDMIIDMQSSFEQKYKIKPSLEKIADEVDSILSTAYEIDDDVEKLTRLPVIKDIAIKKLQMEGRK